MLTWIVLECFFVARADKRKFKVQERREKKIHLYKSSDIATEIDWRLHGPAFATHVIEIEANT